MNRYHWYYRDIRHPIIRSMRVHCAKSLIKGKSSPCLPSDSALLFCFYSLIKPPTSAAWASATKKKCSPDKLSSIDSICVGFHWFSSSLSEKLLMNVGHWTPTLRYCSTILYHTLSYSIVLYRTLSCSIIVVLCPHFPCRIWATRRSDSAPHGHKDSRRLDLSDILAQRTACYNSGSHEFTPHGKSHGTKPQDRKGMRGLAPAKKPEPLPKRGTEINTITNITPLQLFYSSLQ